MLYMSESSLGLSSMNHNPIVTKSGAITKEIVLVDMFQYNFPKIASTFILKTSKSIIIFDVGTSKDIQSLLAFLNNNKLSLKKIRYIIPSHHHFDHFGGGWKLWGELKKFNPNIKVLTTPKIKKKLQKSDNHLIRVQRTFGNLIGVMEPLPEEAYELIDTEADILVPGLSNSQSFQLVETPGHSPDHLSPTLFENDYTKFVFNAESSGSLVNSTKLVTLPSCMPGFIFKEYIKSLQKIIEMKPQNIGFGHFGAVKNQENVAEILQEHHTFSFWFRDFVREKYVEGNSSTRYIVEEFVKAEFEKRVEKEFHKNEILLKTVVALVYGQLVDLGLKQPK